MDLFNSIFYVFTDKSRNLPTKLTLGFSLLILVVVIDNILGFSYYYNNSQRISQTKELTQLLQDTTLAEKEKKHLSRLRSEIIEHKTWKDHTTIFFTSVYPPSNKKPPAVENTNVIEEPPIIDKASAVKPVTTKPTIDRSYTWHFISSSWVILVFMAFIPFIAFFDKTVSLSVGLTIIIIFEPILLGLAWLMAKGFSYIPVLFGDPIFNYVLNALLCTAILSLFGLLGKLSKQS